MGYSFMTIGKIKSFAALTSAYRHNYRIVDVLNADKSKEYLNEELVRMNGTYLDAFKVRIREAGINGVRKNAVLALDIVTTFSREDISHVDIEGWKSDQVKWLRSTFNHAKDNGNNVISVMFHGDETGNVHCHSIVIPIDERGRLCAFSYAGKRHQYIEMQNSYGEMMQTRHGLMRGIKKSIARHEDVKKFYADINAIKIAELPAPSDGESVEEYSRRILSSWDSFKNQCLGQHLEKERKMTEQMSRLNEENLKLKKENRELKEELHNQQITDATKLDHKCEKEL